MWKILFPWQGVCLDAGCGSHGGGIYNLFSLGAEKVYGLDVDSTFVEPVKRYLRTVDLMGSIN